MTQPPPGNGADRSSAADPADDSDASPSARRRQQRRRTRARRHEGPDEQRGGPTSAVPAWTGRPPRAKPKQAAQKAKQAAQPAQAAAAQPTGTAGARKAGGPKTSRGADPRDRGLRDLVGSGPSQVGIGRAMRARDVNRPDAADLAEAERDLVVVRRNWRPKD